MYTMILADDEPIITRGIRKLIDWQKLGVEITQVCEDGPSALSAILKHQPDVAILDISMPGRSGIEILKDIRAAGCDTQVIFLTGFQEFSYARDALAYGAGDYLLKPVNREALLTAVDKCLAQRRRKAPGAAEDNSGQGTAEAGVFLKLSESEGMPAQSYVLAVVFFPEMQNAPQMERRLVRFSVKSALEELADHSGGVAFLKEEQPCLVLTDRTEEACAKLMEEFADRMQEEKHCRVGIALSGELTEMRQIPEAYEACRAEEMHFYMDSTGGARILRLSRREVGDDIRQVRDYIEEHYAENVTLTDMAELVHMNSYYFSGYYKKKTGQNFRDYLTEVRLRNAMHLLLTTDLKSYEIAERVGYRDYRAFNETFAKKYGSTPAAYRKEKRRRKEDRRGQT